MKSWYRRRWFKILASFVLLIVLLFLFRVPLMKMAGNHLIDIDEPEKVEALFVLGGNSKDRASHAVQLYNEGFSPTLVCTGGNIPSVLEAIDTSLYEAEISVSLIRRLGVPESASIALTNSTSTLEEAQEIRAYCELEGLGHVGILSSLFHTNRVRNVFEEQFEDSDVELTFFGAPSSRYDESTWWTSEEGMIMVNNEYMKLLYYLVKH